MGKSVTKSFNGGKIAAKYHTDSIILLMKNIDLRGADCLCRGLYTCIKPLFSDICETAWPINTKINVEPPWEAGKKVYINGTGHITQMAAMPIYGKNL